jgi:parvulin-like peptidyl-prolyl isomerase
LNKLKHSSVKLTSITRSNHFDLQVSECPSANRGGNLGTFKPGMMVKEFDEICFEKEVGVVHGPVTTTFGSHLILITRRYEGEDIKK